jgi:hypothetical protein
MSQHTRGLLGQVFSGENHFSLQRDVVPCMFTVLDLFNLPDPKGHRYLQNVIVVYDMSDMSASDRRHEMA